MTNISHLLINYTYFDIKISFRMFRENITDKACITEQVMGLYDHYSFLFINYL